VGKGGGFSDLEFALLVEAGLIGTETVVATTVHSQLLAEALPETAHDFRLDLLVPVRRSSAAAAPDGPRGSSGSTWMRPRSPPSPSWPPSYRSAEPSAVTCRCAVLQPLRGTTRG
jgi:5-formyltetrahydrofolate cyclo-ligase